MLVNLLKKFYRLANFLIIYQLISAPLINSSIAAEDKKESEGFWNTVKEYMPSVLSGVNAFMTPFLQTQQQQQNTQYDQFKNQFSAQFILQPVAAQNTPGGALFNGCTVLSAQVNKLSSAQQCSAQPPNIIQAGYAGAMIDVMEFNLAQVQKFDVKGNDEFNAQGVGCYDRKIKDLETLLDKRRQEIESYKQRLRLLLDDFNLASKNDLDNIKKYDAFLNGGTGLDKELKDFKFENLFLGSKDPANVCGSIISANEISRAGNAQKGGLRAIEEILFDKTSKPEGGAMSAQELLSNKTQIEQDVRGLANKLASKLNTLGSTSAELGDISFSGTVITKNNAALSKIIGNFNSELSSSIQSLATSEKMSSKVQGSSELTTEFQNISTGGKIDIEELGQRLEAFENEDKKSCLKKSINSNFTDIDTFVKKFKNPSISSRLSETADNELATDIKSFIEDEANIDEFLKKVKSSQSKGSNSNYIMTTGKTLRIGGVKIGASTPMRPAQLLEVFVSRCNKNFKAKNPANPNGYSKADAIAAIKKFAGQKENIRRTAASNLSNKIRNEMLSCPANTSTGVAALSCGKALNPNDGNFCLRTASLCATNMKGCYAKVQGELNKAKTEQKAFVDNYQKNITNFKKNLDKEFKNFNNFMLFNGKSLDDQLRLGANFGIPDVKAELSVIELLQADGIDPSLKIEDPKKYLEKNEEKLDQVLKVVDRQKELILQKVKEVRKQFTDRFKENQRTLEQVISDCQGAIQNTQQALNEQAKAQQENDAKTVMACQKLQAFQADPQSAEHESLADDLSEVVQLVAAMPTPVGQFSKAFSANDQASIAQIRAFSAKCEQDAKEAGFFKTSSSGGLTAGNICKPENRAHVKSMVSGFDKEIDDLCKNPYSDATQTCDKATFLEMIGKKKYCDNDPNQRLVQIQKDTICNETVGGTVKVDTPDEYVAYAAEIRVIDPTICVLEEEGSSSLKQQLANAFNCNEVKKRAGAIGVSACNIPNGSEVSEKGGEFSQSLNQVLGIAGQQMGANQN